MIPVTPTKTYPNHYTMVTGLYPESHGIVANVMYDPVLSDTFQLSDRGSVADGRWYGGEPIWVTAQKDGHKTGSIFWPGTEAVIGGHRPTYWQPYDHSLPPEEIIRQALVLLDLPQDRRPTFLSLYFHLVDDAGTLGPDSSVVDTSLALLDRSLGLLMDGLTERGLQATTNIILTADHGMTAVDTSRLIFLDDYVDVTQSRVIDWAPVVGLRPTEEMQETIYGSLKGAHPHLQIYRREEVPEKYHYSRHYRIPPIIGFADPGWQVTTHAAYQANPNRYQGGAHGFDPEFPDMQAVFIAKGPAFKIGVSTPSFSNLHLYELLAHLLGVTPAPNEGDLDAIRFLLK
jgi:predicted AlkP superfamily pyrophosphatase or phosphodiesterase